MAIKYNDSVDLNFNELLNVIAQNLGADPGTGVAPGRVYYSTALEALRLRTATGWVSLGVAGQGLTNEQVEDIVGLMVTGDTQTGITVAYDDPTGKLNFTVSATSGMITDFTEATQDAVGAALTDSATIDFTYDDTANTITGAVLNSPLLGGQNSAYHLSRANHSGTQLSTTISDFVEAVQDVTGGQITTSPTITWTYDDAAGTATGAVTNSPALNGQAAAYYLSRANHTGTQLSSTISDFTEATQDAIGVGFANGTQTGATLTYDDVGNSLSIAVTNAPLLQGQNGAYYLARANHSGTQLAATISDFSATARGLFSVTDTATLDLTYTSGTGVITGAVLDSPTLQGQNSAYHLARANHTGTQLAATISDFQEVAEDFIGAMFSGNVESGITVTYQDATSKVDFTVTDSPLLQGNNTAYHLARANHTGTQLAATISDFSATARGLFSVTDTATLDLTYTAGTGVITGAVLDSPTVAGATPAQLRDRTTHTGTQTASTISDFNTAVRTNTLNQMTAPAADVSWAGFKITNLANGTATTDAINLSQLNAAVSGMLNKATVRAASTANIATLGAQGSRTIDGVALASGDRALLKDQSTGSQNGIYNVNADFSLTRATDADISAEVKSGLYVFVDQGTANANTGWQLFTDDPITLGTTALDFQKVSGAGQIAAGAGLSKTGDTIDVTAGTGITLAGDAVAVDRTTNGGKVSLIYAAALTGGATSEVVTHNLGTRDVYALVYLNSGAFAEELFTIEHTSTTTVTVRSSASIPAATYRVVVFG